MHNGLITVTTRTSRFAFCLTGFHVISCFFKKKKQIKKEKSFLCQFIILKKNFKARML